MIKKVTSIQQQTPFYDEVELSWFDMQKPNLTAVSKKGVNFVVKTKFSHLHENDVLVCEDGYTIKVARSVDDIFILEFSEVLTFAKMAYEIGNRHQPVRIEPYKIVVLEDMALNDIIQECYALEDVTVEKTKGYFKPNGKSHHAH